MTGTLLASFIADVVSHMAGHAALPSRPQVRGMLRTSIGTLGAVVLPFLFVGLAASARGRPTGGCGPPRSRWSRCWS